ncbi:MraY family glycosyltransferase [Paludibacterium purpuratum]|uniref:UDP-N-acetylmuramyl pentapeptide phosphotransferase/UDP-N-acetylglucosamine-1-phosphate transferase n=1 Tax=Paludibacterium purpuratum TaxID=1144873 RepID=A0A4R7B3Y4_9NEIS|nr:glycosyltransferase [Paludibacterium purpuratum]TDR76740.1 UDP-N-acetylmuramyl pentapeptide phosphotransferase/UDP-N-acetylglucosamine-1-phosphate transferase [Paludibacterium purpuratum]
MLSSFARWSNLNHSAEDYYMLIILCASAVLSFVLSVLLVRYQHLHLRYSADSDLGGVQKFHGSPVPRIGGVAVLAGVVLGSGVASYMLGNLSCLAVLFVALPAFAAGLLEDLTKRVGVRTRLYATFVSALLGAILLHATIQRVGVPILDTILQSSWVLSVLFTMVAVGGVAHSVNIIDGYNGVSGSVSVLIFGALGYVSFKVGDVTLVALSFAALGGVLGFLLLNYPRGLIFAGDGGAYLVGVLIAELSVLLVQRNPQVSPWFPLLLVIYPVFETLFSIYRRKFLQDRAIGHPDALHLHSVIYRRLVRWMVGSREAEHLTRRNSMTAPYLWVLAALSIAPAMLFWQNTVVLMICVLLFILLYISLYRMIIRFKTPRWMVMAQKRGCHRSDP